MDLNLENDYYSLLREMELIIGIEDEPDIRKSIEQFKALRGST
jgi:hypothetical protein